MKIPEVELVIKPKLIEVWYKGRHYSSFAVNEEHKLIYSIHRSDILDSSGTYLVGSGFERLDVYTLVKEILEENSVAIPRYAKRKASTTVIRAPRKQSSNGSSSNDSILEHARDQVLNAILDSLIDNPDQSRAFRQAETARIAKKFKEGLFVVAGVRAALTRGSYGDESRLIAKRKRQRSSLARGRS